MKRTTPELVAELRHMIADEIPLTLHLYDGKEPDRGKRRKEPSYGNAVGLPFTNPFERYLGHYDGWGSSRPGTMAILATEDWCRSRHPTHARRRGPALCARLLMLVGYWRCDLPDPSLEPILSTAIRYAYSVWSDRAPDLLDEPLPYRRLQNAPAARQRRYTPPDGH